MSKKAKNSLTIHSIPDDLLEFILALACFEPEVDDIYEKRPFLDSTEPNLAYEPSSAGVLNLELALVCKKWAQIFPQAVPIDALKNRLSTALDAVCSAFEPVPYLGTWGHGNILETRHARFLSESTLHENSGFGAPGSSPATPVLLEILYGILGPLKHKKSLSNLLQDRTATKKHFGQKLGEFLHKNSEEILQKVDFKCSTSVEGFRFGCGITGYRQQAIVSFDLADAKLDLGIMACFDVGPREGATNLQCCIEILSSEHQKTFERLIGPHLDLSTDQSSISTTYGMQRCIRVFELEKGRGVVGRLYEEKALKKLQKMLKELLPSDSLQSFLISIFLLIGFPPQIFKYFDRFFKAFILTDAQMDLDEAETINDEIIGDIDDVLTFDQSDQCSSLSHIQRPPTAIVAAQRFSELRDEGVRLELLPDRRPYLWGLVDHFTRCVVQEYRLKSSQARFDSFKIDNPLAEQPDFDRGPGAWRNQTFQEALGYYFACELPEDAFEAVKSVAPHLRLVSAEHAYVCAEEYGAQSRTRATIKMEFNDKDRFLFWVEHIKGYNADTMRVWFWSDENHRWVVLPRDQSNDVVENSEDDQHKPKRRAKKASAAAAATEKPPSEGQRRLDALKQHVPAGTNLRQLFLMILRSLTL